MDPRFNGEWSASEIQMVKYLITRHNTNNNYANKKRTDIVGELQAIFPLKEKLEVTKLYLELMVEMMQTVQSNDQHVVASNNHMNGNFVMPVEDHAMGHMKGLCGSLVEEMAAMRIGEVGPQWQPTPRKKRQHIKRVWTIDEHRQFLCGLHVYGRGNWKNISRHFVPNKSPVQVCSHAQGYFRRLKNPTKKQRYGINDVGLNDTKPCKQNNASSWDGPAFSRGAYKPNYNRSNELTSVDSLIQVRLPLLYSSSQACSIHVTTLAIGQQQQMGASSYFMAPMMEGSRSHMA